MRLPDIDDLMQDLQLAKQIAIEDRNPSAIVMATISQAKLLGMDKPLKDVMPNGTQTPEPIADYSMLTDDELRQLQVIAEKMEKVTAHD